MAKAETTPVLEFPQARGLRTDDTVTICRDCRFHKLDWFDWLTGADFSAKCQHELSGSTNPVTGKREQKHCSTMRIMSCGINAKLFEPRESEQSEAAE